MGLLSKVKGKINYLRREIVLLGCRSENVNVPLLQEKFTYLEVNQIQQLKGLTFQYDSEDYQNRFSQNHVFCCWQNENVIISYGWLNPNEKHYLGELALEMSLENKIEVLYDFFTAEAYRGKGLYPALLQKMCLRNTKPKLIYAFSDNYSSIRGIEKAGFQSLGKIKGYNKKIYQLLVKKLWQK